MIKVAGAFIGLMLIPAAASAAIIANGDFEAGLSGWTFANAITATHASAYVDGLGLSATPAQYASTYVFFGDGNRTSVNTLSQSFATTIGKTYSFSFDVVAVAGSVPQNLTYDFGGTGTTLVYAPTNNFNNFSTITGSFVASGITSAAAFSNSSFADGSDIAIDNVSVSAVPEPQSWALMIGGFGLVGASLRRRRVAFAR